MSIILIEGFDLYNGNQANIGIQSAWSITNTGNAVFNVSGRFAGQALQMQNDAAAIWRAFPSAFASFTVANAFRVGTLTGLGVASTTGAVILTSGGSVVNTQIGWRPNQNGSISVYRLTSANAGTLLGTTAAGLLLNNVWHWIDFSGVISTTVGTVVLKVDGVTVLNLSGQNTQGYGTAANVDGLILGSQAGTWNGNQPVNWDDLYVLDSAVTLGERRIETIRPSADTAQKDFTPSSGVINFSRVNDATVNTATYVQSSTVNHLDLYDIVDITGIPTSVDYVQITAFAEKTDVGSRSVKLVADLSGTQLLSSDIILQSSFTKLIFGMAAKPGGGSWDASSVNSLKIGPKVTV